MKIGVFVRTCRAMEELTIGDFVRSHEWADVICVGTYNTSRRTHDILSDYRNYRYMNIKIREYIGVTYDVNGESFPSESGYYQFLNQWSLDENLDWVIFDDADHFCSPALQRDARSMLESSDAPYAYALLMYVWGTTHYFPELNKCCPQERLWGWNPHKWTPDINPEPPFTVEIRNQPDRDIDKALVFPHPPYALLHYSFLTEADVRRKMAFNAARGVAQGFPLETCGRLEPIPEWARLTKNGHL